MDSPMLPHRVNLLAIRRELEKRANPSPADTPGLGQAFVDAYANSHSQQLKSDAMTDVGRMALIALGLGGAARGGIGLLQSLNRNRQKKINSGPTVATLPYPVKAGSVEGIENWFKDVLHGNGAGHKADIPWYGPAMLTTGLGAGYAGWKGVDSLLDSRRQVENDEKLEAAKTRFHDALIAQHMPAAPAAEPRLLGKAAGDDTMTRVGCTLDSVFHRLDGVLTKHANDGKETTGFGLNMYATGGTLAALLTGAMVYNQMQKRSRRAVLDKALARRRSNQFAQRPSEMYAVPEPIEHTPAAGTMPQLSSPE